MGCHQIGDGVIGINQFIMKTHDTDTILIFQEGLSRIFFENPAKVFPG